MTDQKILEAREKFMETLESQLKMDRDLARAAWESGFATAMRLLTEDLKVVRLELQQQHAHGSRRTG